MKKNIIIIISLMLSFNVFAKVDNDTYFNYDLNQTTDTKTYNYDLKTLDNPIEEKKISVSEYNSLNIMGFSFGVTQEEFEEKDSFYKKAISPTLSLKFLKKMLPWLENKYSFSASKNNLIMKQSFLFNFFDNKYIHLKPIIQLGEKVALSEQKNSGYFFLNTGINAYIKYKKILIDFNYLRNYSSFEYDSFNLEALYNIEKDSYIGIYFGLENYIPMNIEYSREGQQNLNLGLIYYY